MISEYCVEKYVIQQVLALFFNKMQTFYVKLLRE